MGNNSWKLHGPRQGSPNGRNGLNEEDRYYTKSQSTTLRVVTRTRIDQVYWRARVSWRYPEWPCDQMSLLTFWSERSPCYNPEGGSPSDTSLSTLWRLTVDPSRVPFLYRRTRQYLRWTWVSSVTENIVETPNRRSKGRSLYSQCSQWHESLQVLYRRIVHKYQEGHIYIKWVVLFKSWYSFQGLLQSL